MRGDHLRKEKLNHSSVRNYGSRGEDEMWTTPDILKSWIHGGIIDRKCKSEHLLHQFDSFEVGRQEVSQEFVGDLPRKGSDCKDKKKVVTIVST